MTNKPTERKVKIAEIFTSVRGEGKHLGKPSTFIRFFGCNLRCQFKNGSCDSPHAVIEGEDKCIIYTAKKLAKMIFYSKSPKHLVLTGGEPLLYQDFILEFLKELYMLDSKYYVEVETNGTIAPKLNMNLLIDWFSISPKLKNSNQESEFHDTRRINHIALSRFSPHKSSFNFVLGDLDEDTEDNLCDDMELKAITQKFPKLKVFVMPEGDNKNDVIRNSKYVVQYCINNNFTFSLRESIIIWNNKRIR